MGSMEPSTAPSPSPSSRSSSCSSVQSLRAQLVALNLDPRGHKDVLSKRLKRHQKGLAEAERAEARRAAELERARAMSLREKQTYDSFLVCDVEATCERGKNFRWPNEIIEFPVVLLQWRKKPPSSSSLPSRANIPSSSPSSPSPPSSSSDHDDEELVIVDTYRSFVRPVWRPQLSDFCKSLTGITQAQVDAAPTFDKVLDDFYETFLQKHELFTPGSTKRALWCTDGVEDIRTFVVKSCFISGTPMPPWFQGGINDVKVSCAKYLASLRLAEDESSNPSPPERDSSPTLPPEREDDPTPTGCSDDEPSPAPSTNPCQPSSSSLTPSQSTSPAPALPAAADPQWLPSPPRSSPTPRTCVRKAAKPKAKKSMPMVLLTLPKMLNALELGEFEGRAHSGIDDARNIARIVQALVVRGWAVLPNFTVHERDRRWSWMGPNHTVRYREPEGGAGEANGRESRRRGRGKGGWL